MQRQELLGPDFDGAKFVMSMIFLLRSLAARNIPMHFMQ
jgi:hypothetical protein